MKKLLIVLIAIANIAAAQDSQQNQQTKTRVKTKTHTTKTVQKSTDEYTDQKTSLDGKTFKIYFSSAKTKSGMNNSMNESNKDYNNSSGNNSSGSTAQSNMNRDTPVQQQTKICIAFRSGKNRRNTKPPY